MVIPPQLCKTKLIKLAQETMNKSMVLEKKTKNDARFVEEKTTTKEKQSINDTKSKP